MFPVQMNKTLMAASLEPAPAATRLGTVGFVVGSTRRWGAETAGPRGKLMSGECREPLEIDAEWMTEAFDHAGVAQGAVVDRVDFEGFIGTGQMGRNARYSLSWDTAAGRPTSVVGKFPAEDPTACATGFATGVYRREWVFYSEMHSTVTTRTPHIWAARFDESAQKFVLLMEDLNRSVPGDQLEGLTADQAGLAVAEAVGFHAPHWGNPNLEAVFGYTLEEAVALTQVFYDTYHEATLERVGDRLDTDSVALVRDLAPLVETSAFLSDTPHTLIHNDYRPDNFLFADGPGAPPLVVVDWQMAGAGLGPTDIAFALGGGFDPEERVQVERELVGEYGDRLRAAGVDYDDETCWRDYRIGSLWGVVLSTLALMTAEQTERGDEILTMMLRRHARHVLDLEALDIVRQAAR